MSTVEEIEALDPAAETPGRPLPAWAASRVAAFNSLGDVRREMAAVYWLWRKHGRLSVGHMQSALTGLRIIGQQLEAERDDAVEGMRRELEELRAEVQRRQGPRVVGRP